MCRALETPFATRSNVTQSRHEKRNSGERPLIHGRPRSANCLAAAPQLRLPLGGGRAGRHDKCKKTDSS
ncbi:hypothetical protein EVAR_88963_1 [Eumeta japonica]|uniref:Uncharacterized protein n=1 Tax=Eumeta variegata TaxID=151549 RepID=A0A4C1VR87_EUMVA|nr:hypothetical protein EVAR_88963_1 [Eumeta japonica]